MRARIEEQIMTIQLTRDGWVQDESLWRNRMTIAIADLRCRMFALRERLRLAHILRAAGRRRRQMLRALGPFDDRIFAELAQMRAELEFTYRNNLDLR
jgi:hypothetical protein